MTGAWVRRRSTLSVLRRLFLAHQESYRGQKNFLLELIRESFND